MYRCVLAFVTALVFACPAFAQVQRNFPPNALRGEISFGEPPEIALNGSPARLAPGARIRGQDDMQLLSATLIGQKATVHYTIDINGQVKDVWILRPQELANLPWPTTPQEAATWTFDVAAQIWTRK